MCHLRHVDGGHFATAAIENKYADTKNISKGRITECRQTGLLLKSSRLGYKQHDITLLPQFYDIYTFLFSDFNTSHIRMYLTIEKYSSEFSTPHPEPS